MSDTPDSTPAKVRKVGPRGFEGLIGWTFFDPANLLAVTLLVGSAALVVVSMQGRGSDSWPIALGLYLCLATFLRGYFFNYYNGGLFGRILVLLVLEFGLLGTAAMWEDRAGAHDVLRDTGVEALPAAAGFHVAALLHAVIAATLLIHMLIPRAWLMRATDEIADSAGRDRAPDAPPETVDEPAEG